jgi:hypothetical protein
MICQHAAVELTLEMHRDPASICWTYSYLELSIKRDITAHAIDAALRCIVAKPSSGATRCSRHTSTGVDHQTAPQYVRVTFVLTT